MKDDFHHVTDPGIRAALNADPKTLRPSVIWRLVQDAVFHAQMDLGDPEVLNAGERAEIAEEAEAAFADDPIKAHAFVRQFWSI